MESNDKHFAISSLHVTNLPYRPYGPYRPYCPYLFLFCHFLTIEDRIMRNAKCDDIDDGVSFVESTVSSTSDSASESDENSSIGLDARKSNQNCATALVIPDEISVMECKVGSTSTSVAVVNDSTEDLNDNKNPPTSDLREKISVIDIELDGASNDKFSSNICSDNNPVKNNSSCDSNKHTSQGNLHQNLMCAKRKKCLRARGIRI